MSPWQLLPISTSLTRRASLLAMVAVWLVGIVWSVPAVAAEQGLKIRLVDAEVAEGEVWDQQIGKIGAEVLTPPEEKTTEALPSLPVAEDEPHSAMPGYLADVGSGVLNDTVSEPGSLPDPGPLPYNEPSLAGYGQQRFQRGLLGIHEHLLSTPGDLQEEEASLLLPDHQGMVAGESSPELVWRFAPLRRLRFLGSRLFGGGFSEHGVWERRHASGPFAKLFPWNRTPGRNQGVGEPLVNDSWRWAPFGIGWFMGYMDGKTLVNDWTGAKGGFFGGYHLNWDFDHYWGFEFRYGFASLAQWDQMLLYDTETHGLPSSQMRKRHAMLKYGDFSFLYYPWGDARWRPYAKMGLGWGYVKFTDLNYRLWSNTTLTLPMGIGLKYRYSRRLVFRMEMMDNFLVGERGINPQHNLSLTAGIEVRFGGSRKAYWPYNPGLHYW